MDILEVDTIASALLLAPRRQFARYWQRGETLAAVLTYGVDSVADAAAVRKQQTCLGSKNRNAKSDSVQIAEVWLASRLHSVFDIWQR